MTLTVSVTILPVAKLSVGKDGVDLKTTKGVDTRGWACSLTYAEGDPAPPPQVIADIPCTLVKVSGQQAASGLAPFRGITLFP